MKDQVWLYHFSPFRVLWTVNFGVNGLYRVIHLVFHKEKYFTRKYPDGKVLGTTLRSADRIKLGGYEVSGFVSLYVPFDVPNHFNLGGGVVPGEVGIMGILKVTYVGIKLGILYGEVLGTTLGYADGFKPGCKE